MKQSIITIMLAVFFGAFSGSIATKVILRRPIENIVAKHLTIVDDTGSRRATLGTDSQDQISLAFWNPRQMRQLLIGVTRSDGTPGHDSSLDLQRWSPVMDFREELGHESALFTTTSKGNSLLTLYGDGGSSRMELGYIGLGTDSGKRFGAWGVRAING